MDIGTTEDGRRPPSPPAARPLPLQPVRRARWAILLLPGLRLKRWLAMMGGGLLILVLGAGYLVRFLYAEGFKLPGVFRYVLLANLPQPARALIFATVGITALVYGLYRFQKAIINPLMRDRDNNVLDVLYDYQVLSRGPRIVAIGGGTGLSTLLRGIKDYTSNLSAVVTVADDGGSSGRLREEYRILPPGDIRQCIVALADAEPLVKELFNHRFRDGSLSGHSFGNLFITAMNEVTGNFEMAVRESARVLAVRGDILPSTLQDVTLLAEIEGRTVEGESRIPESNAPITRVFIRPDDAPLNEEARTRILEADLILIGPGSLYTSILPNLLIKEMAATIKASRALKVFVCNVAGQHGETEGFTVADYLEVIRSHVGCDLFDYVVVNSNFTHTPTGGQSLVRFDPESVRSNPARFLLADVVNHQVPSHHDPQKLARLILRRVWQS